MGSPSTARFKPKRFTTSSRSERGWSFYQAVVRGLATRGATRRWAVWRKRLVAGVPAVVASLWDIDDDSAAGLMEKFHARIA